jgi:hypothetical protein
MVFNGGLCALRCRHCTLICRCLNLQVIHPIHDQTFYLDVEQKRRLKEEYGENLRILKFSEPLHNFQVCGLCVGVVINSPSNDWSPCRN